MKVKRLHFGLMAVIACLSLMPLPAMSVAPQTINYQGMLKTAGGAPVNGSVQMQFSLYTSPTSTPALWTEVQSSVTVTAGQYSVFLGRVTPINLPFDAQYYLGITIGTDAEMTPRQPLTSTAYAFRAAVADGLSTSATLTSANVIVSTVPNGTSPLQVASNTMVPNLNVEMVGGKHASDFVAKTGDTMTGSLGISVIGSNTALLSSSTGSGNAIYAANSGSGDTMYVLNSGTGRGAYFVNNGPANVMPAVVAVHGGDGAALYGFVDSSRNGTAVTGDAGGTGRAGYFNGRVGIGTPNPNEQLEITGNLRFPATTSTTGIIRSGPNTFIHSYGSNNFFAGENAGNLTMTGWGNTAIGPVALTSNTNGTRNTANGYAALGYNNSGSFNVASGTYALANNSIGSNNTADGYQALFTNTTGSFNTASGSQALYANSIGRNNTAIGYQALAANDIGSSNTANGTQALYSNSSGIENTANGYQALYLNATGNANTAGGSKALYFNNTGNNNTANGYYALYSNTTGNDNTASGMNALSSNMSGYFNSASGVSALYSNTTGIGNTAQGVFALLSNSTGTSNAAVGMESLKNNNTGYGNTATGNQALITNTTGSYNTAVGYNANVAAQGLTNATAIGANAVVGKSNSIVLGGTGDYAVNVGIGTTTPEVSLDVANTFRVLGTASTIGPPTGSGLEISYNSLNNSGEIVAIDHNTNNVGAIFIQASPIYVNTSSLNNIALSHIYFGGPSQAVAMEINGDLRVQGNLVKGSGSFKIDHPLDPRNKYLYHSFVESPDMKNIYDGVVTTDDKGFAVLTLPGWFEALNRDFRYQLTIIGNGSWARARVAEEIANNRFVIETDVPNTKVSWQVTGIRKDAYAEKHRIPVEEMKPGNEQGTCLHQEACEQ